MTDPVKHLEYYSKTSKNGICVANNPNIHYDITVNKNKAERRRKPCLIMLI